MQLRSASTSSRARPKADGARICTERRATAGSRARNERAAGGLRRKSSRSRLGHCLHGGGRAWPCAIGSRERDLEGAYHIHGKGHSWFLDRVTPSSAEFMPGRGSQLERFPLDVKCNSYRGGPSGTQIRIQILRRRRRCCSWRAAVASAGQRIDASSSRPAFNPTGSPGGRTQRNRAAPEETAHPDRGLELILE